MDSFAKYNRARLQRECKALGIKANLSNIVMWGLISRIRRGEKVEDKYYKKEVLLKRDAVLAKPSPQPTPFWQKVVERQQAIIEIQAAKGGEKLQLGEKLDAVLSELNRLSAEIDELISHV